MKTTPIAPRSVALQAVALPAALVVAMLSPSMARTLTGTAAFGDWRDDAPGVVRHIGAADLPRPYATRSAGNAPSIVAPPADFAPKVPPGFTVSRFATKLEAPRLMRVAPNGDIFVAETDAGRITVLHATDGAATAASRTVFAGDLDAPFGIAFYPPGPNPKWVYVAETNAIKRFAYDNGRATAVGAPETIVPRLTRGTDGHSTRDIAFSPDGTRLYVSVGSASNDAESMPQRGTQAIADWQAKHGLGAAWDEETDRADVLVFDPRGGNRHVLASGIRNCVGLAVQAGSGTVWCATNERDGLGDDLVPDYVTRVREGGFYGWPWTYIGDNEDPRHRGERPDLAGKAIVPDVLLQPHSAALQMAFYDAPASAPSAFPAPYAGDAFVALHGSWNRSRRTGYKLVRVTLRDGVPTGDYEDVMTGFVADDRTVRGRPVGVAVAHDGALLVSDDAGGIVWRLAPAARP